MDLSDRKKVDASFSMASMTDIIFLLLVFFMLTSSFVTPSGLPVNLPGSKSSEIVMQKVSVTITKDLQYYVNGETVNPDNLRSALKAQLANADKGTVVLHLDKSVPTEHFVKVAGIATELEAKVSIATRPEKE